MHTRTPLSAIRTLLAVGQASMKQCWIRTTAHAAGAGGVLPVTLGAVPVR
ncbi:hypothetical protein [Streptomyces sp. NPDC054783]